MNTGDAEAVSGGADEADGAPSQGATRHRGEPSVHPAPGPVSRGVGEHRQGGRAHERGGGQAARHDRGMYVYTYVDVYM